MSGDGTIQLRVAGSRTWRTVSLRRLALEYAADHPLWAQLRRRGVRRPSPSGPTVPENQRKHHRCTLRLAETEIACLDALAVRAGTSRSEVVRGLLATAVPPTNHTELLAKKS